MEHSVFDVIAARGMALQSALAPWHGFPAPKLVFLTTLRDGTSRALSHWAHCTIQEPVVVKDGSTRCTLGMIPMPEKPAWDDNSLVQFLLKDNTPPGAKPKQGLRINNAHVGALASEPEHTTVLNPLHLAKAKQTLLSSSIDLPDGTRAEGFSWVVGFTECLEDLYRFFAAGMGIPEHVASETASVHYEQRASSSHSEGDNRRRTSVKVTPHGRFLTADPAERRLATTTGLKQGAKLATTMNGLDNDLWSWAHEMANGANHNPRTTFVGCRDPPAPQPSD